MDWFVTTGHSSLFKGLGKSWVGVASACNVLGGGAVLHCEHAFSNHLACVWTHNPDTEDFIGLSTSQNLYKSLSIVIGPRSAIGHEGETSFLELDSFCLQLFLGLAYIGNFGVGVNDTRNSIVVDMATLAEDVLNSRNSLFFGLVSEHLASGCVADAVDVGGFSLPCVRVDLDLTEFICLEASFFKLKATGVSVSSDRN